jgi:hypothetical protein
VFALVAARAHPPEHHQAGPSTRLRQSPRGRFTVHLPSRQRGCWPRCPAGIMWMPVLRGEHTRTGRRRGGRSGPPKCGDWQDRPRSRHPPPATRGWSARPRHGLGGPGYPRLPRHSDGMPLAVRLGRAQTRSGPFGVRLPNAKARQQEPPWPGRARGGPCTRMTGERRRDDAGHARHLCRHGTARRGYRQDANQRLSVRLGPGYPHRAATPSGRTARGSRSPLARGRSRSTARHQ